MNDWSRILRFVKSSGIYLIGNVLSKALIFFMLPIYTRYIPTGDMGVYDISITYLNMLTSVVYFEMWTAVLRYLYDAQDPDRKRAVENAGLALFFLASVLYALAGLALGMALGQKYLGWILLYGFMLGMTNIMSFCARGMGRNMDFAVSGVVNVLVNVCAHIVLIVFMGVDYSAMYIAFALGALGQILYLEGKTGSIRAFSLRALDHPLTRSMFRYALPFCANTVAYWFLSSFNRIVVNLRFGDSFSGIYAVGNKFGMLITLVTTCFTYAWQDVAFSYESDRQRDPHFYSKSTSLYFRFLLSGFILLLPAVKPVFSVLVDRSYEAAESYISLFMLVATISALNGFVGNIFNSIKSTASVFVSTVVAAVVNCAIAFPLVGFLGIDGANWAALIGFAASILIRSALLKRKIGYRMDVRVVLALALMCMLNLFLYARLDGVSTLWLYLINLPAGIFLMKGKIWGEGFDR